MKRFTISYRDRLLFCFVAGILGGTILANLLSSEIKQQIGYFDTMFLTGQTMGAAERRQMWVYVLRQRSLEVVGAWLLSMTTLSSPGFCALSAMAGGGIAVVLSIITVEKGMMGLLFYLATVLPHGLFYLPVWLILASWAGEEKHTLRIPALLLLMMFLAAGTVAEAWLSPLILHFITKV